MIKTQKTNIENKPPQGDGGFSITLILSAGYNYRFRYMLDGQARRIQCSSCET